MERLRGDGDRGPGVGAWRATLSGLCASLVGIGLARFAYTPLIPALVEARWFGPADAAYLGAANLAGYLVGALAAAPLARRAPVGVVLRAMMLLASLGFIACAAPLSFLWYFLWRFAAGVAGGALMVLAATAVLAQVPPGRQGLAGGIVFTGVALGIVVSGTFVPLTLRTGLVETWLALGALALLLTALAWSGWPREPRAPRRPAAGPSLTRDALTPRLLGLYLAYGLNAVGLVPHMVFLVDFVARGLGQGLVVGARYWVLFGLGALLGPLLTGAVADRIGFAVALRVAFVVQALAVGLLAVADAATALAVSAVAVGAFVPGIVPLVLGRVHELVARDRDSRRAAWSLATTGFALGQAAAAYGFSYLFELRGSYTLLFGLAVAALASALVLELMTATLARRRGPGMSRGRAP